MKKLITFCIAAIITLSFFATSCKKITYAEIGEPVSLEKNLIGTWKLDSIVQVDQGAVDKGFPANVQRLNITGLFTYNTLGVNFTDAGTGNAGAFTFTNPGNAPIFFATTGNWNYVENGGPIRVRLAGTSRADTIDFAKAYRVTDNKLALRVNRRFYSNNKVFTYYDLNFSKN